MLHCWKKINKNVSVGTPKRHVWCVGNFKHFGYGEKMNYQLSFVFNFSHTFPGSTLLSSKLDVVLWTSALQFWLNRVDLDCAVRKGVTTVEDKWQLMAHFLTIS